MSPDFSCGDVRLFLGDCFDVMPKLSGVDAVISDPPFSARTHAGHDDVAATGYDSERRVKLGYPHWTQYDVAKACAFLPKKGWVCIFTDHTLGRDWEKFLRNFDRYVFAPVPVVVPGRSVRLTGDGPSSWTDWLIVSRTKNEVRWGTLPGYYEGRRGSIEHMGGKPLNVMCRIVEHYSRPGDTVLDFCMGAGTTGVACLRTGRKFIGIEKEPRFFEAAKQRIERELSQRTLAI